MLSSLTSPVKKMADEFPYSAIHVPVLVPEKWHPTTGTFAVPYGRLSRINWKKNKKSY